MSTLGRRSALLATAILLTACGGHETPPSRVIEPASLQTFTVTPQARPRELVLDATLEAVNRSTVAAETTGRVDELPFDVNDFVNKGDIIVRFRNREQAARLNTATANQRVAQANLNDARAQFERTRDIHARGLIAQAQLDKARAAQDAAQAQLEATQAQVDAAREAFERTVVRAPYSGIVVERHIELGESASPGQPLMTGLSLEHLRALVDVPQSSVAAARRANSARVILPDGRSVTSASLRFTPSASPGTHTVRVRVQLPVGDFGAYPGTLVKVAFPLGDTQALLLPPSALVRRGEVTGVYVLDDNGRVSLRQIRIGDPLPDGRIPVLAGLSAGERVAAQPSAATLAAQQQVDA